jgi:predicted dehydrogenase
MCAYNIAIVGCGHVSNEHFNAWKNIPQARVVAVCDINDNAVKNVARTWGISRYYTSTSELLGSKDINLIDICTPPHTHASLAVQAMKSGFDVLIEKPMALHAKDALEILDCQKTTGRRVGVVHNWLYRDSVIRASSIVKSGALGEILSATVEYLGTPEDQMVRNERHWCHTIPGGKLGETLPHPIYLLQHFLGNLEVENVLSSKMGYYPWMKYDELCVTCKSGKRLGRIYISFNAPREGVFISIYGTKAILKLDAITATLNVLPKMSGSWFSRGIDSLRQASQLTMSVIRNATKVMLRQWETGHEAYIRMFAESLIRNTELPVALETAYEVVRVHEMINERIEKPQHK